VETLLAQMDRNGVERAVLVQLLGVYDNSYVVDCVRRFPDRLAAVVGVDPAAPDALQSLEQLKALGASGVRLRPTARSAGEDELAIWRAAERLSLPVSCVGNTASFCAAAFSSVLEAVPALPVVLEHLGGTSTPDTTEALQTERAQVLSLARFANVYLKVPGLGEFEPRKPGADPQAPQVDLRSAATVLRRVLHAVPATRLMWGSDFPVVASREGYANALGWCRSVLDAVTAEASREIFAGTARRVFFPSR
jgi:L-fuconolactonase